MNDFEIMEELEIKKKLMFKLVDFLIECDINYKLEVWDSGEGSDLIIVGSEGDLENQYKILFEFGNSGGVDISVEKVEGE